MTATRYAVDTSAWFIARRDPELWSRLSTLVFTDRILMCAPIRFEILHSSRNSKEFDEIRIELEQLPELPIDAGTWDATFDLFGTLARRGGSHHRELGMVDGLVACAAAHAGVSVLHYDRHYDVIAAITGQPTEWIAPRGSL